MRFGLICLATALLAVGVAASRVVADGSEDCTSNSWAVPQGEGWTMECPGTCEPGETCKADAWVSLEGHEELQCACWDGEGCVTRVAGDAECVPWLERAWDSDEERWVYDLKCGDRNCPTATGECPKQQVSGPKWICFCPSP